MQQLNIEEMRVISVIVNKIFRIFNKTAKTQTVLFSFLFQLSVKTFPQLASALCENTGYYLTKCPINYEIQTNFNISLESLGTLPEFVSFLIYLSILSYLNEVIGYHASADNW